jgi:hypothetical protein
VRTVDVYLVYHRPENHRGLLDRTVSGAEDDWDPFSARSSLRQETFRCRPRAMLGELASSSMRVIRRERLRMTERVDGDVGQRHPFGLWHLMAAGGNKNGSRRERATRHQPRGLTWNHRHRKEGRATSDRKGLRYFAIPLTEVRQMYIGGGVVALIIIILLLVWLL